jgi:phytanoyl-CoA hydroxylase
MLAKYRILTDMTMEMVSEDRVSFEKNGFLLKANVFSRDDMDALKAHCKEQITEDNETGVYVYPGDRCSKALNDICCHPGLVDVLKDIVNKNVEFLSVKTVYKSGDLTFSSPWHQDRAYWMGTAKVSVWLAMDDVSIANGCLKVIPGSHIEFLDHDSSDENKFQNRIDDDVLADREQISVEMSKGDALFFHDQLLHASHENTSKTDRWSLIPTYRDSDVHDPTSLRIELWKNPIAL